MGENGPTNEQYEAALKVLAGGEKKSVTSPNFKPFTSFTFILAICIGLPILIFGTSAAIKFISIMNTPIINGQVPIWWIIVIIGLIMWMQRR